jgi:hypothetical protein
MFTIGVSLYDVGTLLGDIMMRHHSYVIDVAFPDVVWLSSEMNLAGLH